jgi:transcription elongation factor Elf1
MLMGGLSEVDGKRKTMFIRCGVCGFLYEIYAPQSKGFFFRCLHCGRGFNIEPKTTKRFIVRRK